MAKDAEATLQWGRGLMAAETGAIDFIYISDATWLQWGRGLMAAETRRVLVDAPDVGVASMGPRLDGRGDADKLGLNWLEAGGRLQWGRGLMAAETPRRCR